MPDLDGAHGFVTALLPLHTAPCPRADGSMTSPSHAVREFLASLPTAQHSPACAESGLQSPFAKSRTTHFARFAVIDAPAFEGREPRDAILTALSLAPDPMQAQPADALGRSYLLFCADFDRSEVSAAPIRDYLLDLWGVMKGEWTELLRHCEGWREGAAAQGFADYVQGCMVETTMPFNDYGVSGAPASARPPIVGALAPVVVTSLALLIVGLLLAARTHRAWAYGLAIGLVLLFMIAAASWAVLRAGRIGQPWREGVDLRTVLKALHVQAAFTRFATRNHGAPPAELQAAFRAFLIDVRLADLDNPTQPAGTVPQPGAGR